MVLILILLFVISEYKVLLYRVVTQPWKHTIPDQDIFCFVLFCFVFVSFNGLHNEHFDLCHSLLCSCLFIVTGSDIALLDSWDAGCVSLQLIPSEA